MNIEQQGIQENNVIPIRQRQEKEIEEANQIVKGKLMETIEQNNDNGHLNAIDVEKLNSEDFCIFEKFLNGDLTENCQEFQTYCQRVNERCANWLKSNSKLPRNYESSLMLSGYLRNEFINRASLEKQRRKLAAQ